MFEQRDKFYTNDNICTNASMRPSSSDTGDAYLSVLSKSSYDTCVNYASLSATDISVSNQTPAEHESSHTDSTLSTGSGLVNLCLPRCLRADSLQLRICQMI